MEMVVWKLTMYNLASCKQSKEKDREKSQIWLQGLSSGQLLWMVLLNAKEELCEAREV